MQTPILGFSEGIAVFPSKEYAEGYIEPIDAESDEWEVFDATGQLLTLTVHCKRHWIPFLSSEWVTLSACQPPKVEVERLRGHLVRCLSEVPVKARSKLGMPLDDAVLHAAPLDELVRLAERAAASHAI